MLTRRERQVANAAFLGHRDRVIAAQLGLGEQTVTNTLSRIYDKLGAGTRLDLWVLLWAHPEWLDEANGRVV